jgi:hypothetical protein
MNNVLLSDGIHLTQNAVYRGRLSVSFLGSQKAVSDGLGKQGFTEVVFFEKDALPADWPDDQKADEANWPNWEAYLQGRFTMTDRVIALSELPAGITLQGMWLQQAPAAPQPLPPSPGPPAPSDPGLPPYTPPPPEKPSMVGPLVASAAGVALGFAAAKFLGRKKGTA